jgi:hypothetical protein
MEFAFPGIPTPPLQSLFLICKSMGNWLRTDDKNVIVLHCGTSKGRSSLVASCFLGYMFHDAFENTWDCFFFYASQAGLDFQTVLFPSQMRYLTYFEEVLNGFIPLHKPLILSRIVMQGIPKIVV